VVNESFIALISFVESHIIIALICYCKVDVEFFVTLTSLVQLDFLSNTVALPSIPVMLVLMHPTVHLIFPILLALVSIFVLDSLKAKFNGSTSGYNPNMSILIAL
jgi:hypothetical protein